MGIKTIKFSVLYLALGLLLGLYMSIADDYTLTSVHVHINLLGWTTLTIAGILYYLFPELTDHFLAKAHFWLHNIGLPVMMVGLVFTVSGTNSLLLLTIIGSTATVIGLLFFVYNVLVNLK
ncbi:MULTISPECIES: cytochrome-c oxidase [Metabacillus]|uniref:Cytochrome-c oxidase n=1 Tax=Metabacillus hrfriensis TaxID=3048891 RepID=A0ACD4RGJ6_9BACI|nr:MULTISPECIES: cytochrome-c oxidase [Metabacillus]UAL53939.1 cytochrome-c oxidase [Metabacillus dongyingensis]UOK59331.1 cytochrome-c oxidase [Bacillus sp. OVS6]USK30253.1 cytochrome-c oxidase [Bacillus sp. CMF21]WHZ59502.1 cytochrome-c oxidase [Metabacillus sp. CT-WN-B3]